MNFENSICYICCGRLCRRRRRPRTPVDVKPNDGLPLLVRSNVSDCEIRVPPAPGNHKSKLRTWDNRVKTSQYTWWNFLPLNIFYQISQPANFYFFVMAMLQLIEPISDSNGVPTFLVPLAIVMSITALKDAYEDLQRHRSDDEENNRMVTVIDPATGGPKEAKWASLAPGQIVKLTAEQRVPADLVLLGCSDEFGIAYVETAQLDGETNLKNKTCIPQLLDALRTDADVARCRVETEYEPPNSHIYKFNGIIRVSEALSEFPPYIPPPHYLTSNIMATGNCCARFVEILTCGYCCKSRHHKIQTLPSDTLANHIVPAGGNDDESRPSQSVHLARSDAPHSQGMASSVGWSDRARTSPDERPLNYSNEDEDAVSFTPVTSNVLISVASSHEAPPPPSSRHLYRYSHRSPSEPHSPRFSESHSGSPRDERLRHQASSPSHAIGSESPSPHVIYHRTASHGAPPDDSPHLASPHLASPHSASPHPASPPIASPHATSPAPRAPPVQGQTSPPELNQASSWLSDGEAFSNHSVSQEGSEEEGCEGEFSLSIEQFVWRGAHVVNTQFIYGLVVYTGHNTRIFQNSKSRALKASGLHASYNSHAIMLAICQFSMCLFTAILFASFDMSVNRFYLQDISSASQPINYPFLAWLALVGVGFGRFVLLLSYFVPITLLVQLEIARWCQSMFLNWDDRMYSQVSDRRATAHTVSVIEELGRITHVFSDKTGTLTCNVMQLRCLGVGDKLFGWDDEDDFEEFEKLPDRLAQHSNDFSPSQSAPPQPAGDLTRDQRPSDLHSLVLPNHFVDFDARRFRAVVAKSPEDFQKQLRSLLLILALCHSVLPKYSGTAYETIAHGIVSTDKAESPRRPAAPNSTPDPSIDSSSVVSTPRPSAHSLEHAATMTLEEGDPSNETNLNPASTVPRLKLGVTSNSSQPQSSADHRSSVQFELMSVGSSEMSPVNQRQGLRGYESVGYEESETVLCISSSELFQSQQQHEAPPPDDTPQPNTEPTSLNAPQTSLNLPQTSLNLPPTPPPLPTSTSTPTVLPTPTGSDEGLRPTPRRGSGSRQRRRPPPIQAPSLVRWKPAAEVQYDASSPDELALVSGARHLGVEFMVRPTLNTIQVCMLNPVVEALLLCDADKASAADLYERYNKDRRQSKDLLEGTGTTSVPRSGQSSDVSHGDVRKDSLASPLGGGVGVEDNSEGYPVTSLVYDVLEILEFDNVRKRMSVLMRDRDGQCRLLCKGADSSMVAIAAPGQEDLIQGLNANLSYIARQGLRTLVLGERPVSDSEVRRFREALREAKRTVGDDREDVVRGTFDLIERDLYIAGCTGIEDRLQEGVPSTIEDIKSSGVKLWVLTGDKVETAVSIGYSSNILTEATFNATIMGSTAEEVRQDLIRYTSFIVATDLARDKFEMMIASQLDALNKSPSRDESGFESLASSSFSASENNALGCFRCLAEACRPKGACGGGGDGTNKKTGKKRKAKYTPPELSLDDFFNFITFQATHTPVRVPQEKRRRPKTLTADQIQTIVESYVEAFGESEVGREALKAKGGGSKVSLGAQSGERGLGLGGGMGVGTGDEMGLGEQKGGQMPLSAPPLASDLYSYHPPEHHSGASTFREIGQSSRQPSPRLRQNQNTGTLSHHVGFIDDVERKKLGGGDDEGKPSVEATKPRAPPHPSRSTEHTVQGYQEVAITITGEALGLALDNEENRKRFFALADLCSTVIACRVTPKQKAEIISEYKRFKSSMVSLSVGDGANDVGMIVTANVGVGISGKEGLQAVRAADFSLGEFRFLKNIMFAHGRESLRRNAVQVYHTVWKNVLFGAADFFYGFVSLFSATDIFNSWLKQIFNLTFTAFPIMCFAVFDRQLPLDIFVACPPLYPTYSAGEQGGGHEQFFGKRHFTNWFLYAIYCCCICVMVPLYGYNLGADHLNGKVSVDIASYGMTVFWVVILVSNVTLIPFINTWHWFMFVAFALNAILWFVAWWACPLLPVDFCPELYGTLSSSHKQAFFYFSVVLAVVVSLLPQWMRWFASVFNPAPVAVIRERIAKGVFDVVMAPKKTGGLAVVVPRKKEEEWRGFAFAEETSNRFGVHRRRSSLHQSQSGDQLSPPHSQRYGPSLTTLQEGREGEDSTPGRQGSQGGGGTTRRGAEQFTSVLRKIIPTSGTSTQQDKDRSQ
eukprot:GHVN01094025.1.p1 GENE.GHVN01094025.1~~GHVN01094025.1.p1  ORF type:complete len:2168 (-),score=405.55 GHVN01094025.1:378-6881(-)